MSTTFNAEIQRLAQAKEDIKQAIEEKGVVVGNGLIDGYAEKIKQIKAAGKQQAKSAKVTKNNSTTVISPDDGYVGLDKVTVTTQIPIQDKKVIDIAVNGGYSVAVDEGYEGLKKVDIAVNVPIQDSKSLEVKKNGTYTISKDDEYEGLKEVEVVVSLPETGGKTKIYNGISFRKSTFETLEWDKYDWSDVYDGYGMFTDCPNFNDVKGALEHIPVKCTIGMFSGCNAITEVRDIDFTQYAATYAMFAGCENIEYVSNVIFPAIRLTNDNNPNNDTITSNDIRIGRFDYTVFDDTCDWTNVIMNNSTIRDKSNAFAEGRFAHIKGLNDANTLLFGNITVQVLDCDKPSSMISSGNSGSEVQYYFYKENAGWGDILSPTYSCPIGLHLYCTDTDNEHNIVYIGDRYNIEDKFEYLGNGHYYRPYTSWMLNGKLMFDGEEIINGSWLRQSSSRLNDMTIYFPIQPVENVIYEGEELIKLVKSILKNWEFDSEKNALKSNYHSGGKNSFTGPVKETNCLMKITTKGFNTIDFVYGQSSEKNYDFLTVWAGDTLIFSAKGFEGDDITTTLNVSDYDSIEFSYGKDGSGDNGEDAAWIKSIKYYNV